MDLNKRLDDLIARIVFATRLTQNQIESRAGYSKGRLSQVKSKGQVTLRLLKNLENEFKNELAGKPTPDLAHASESADDPLSAKNLLQAILEMMRTQNKILERQADYIQHRVESLDISLTDALNRVDGLGYDLVSGRQVVLQSLARLEKKQQDALLAEADSIKIDLLKARGKQSRAVKGKGRN
jgi:transcriptional regulator with XRE-family HTH domain